MQGLLEFVLLLFVVVVVEWRGCSGAAVGMAVFTGHSFACVVDFIVVAFRCFCTMEDEADEEVGEAVISGLCLLVPALRRPMVIY